MRQVLLRFIKDPLLRRVFRGTGSLAQARNELRWIKEEAPDRVFEAASLRSKGMPLQYVLGTQPFGSLDIRCKPGVLIPRWETEEWVAKLAKKFTNPIRILDIGTGTGCILFLLLNAIPRASGMGLDVSPSAIDLFNENRRVLGLDSRAEACPHDLHTPLIATEFDLVVSNPPYVTSLSDADRDVRVYEPALALLEQPKIYEDLVERVFEARAQMAVFEVGNEQQIQRCIELFRSKGWDAWGERDAAGNWRTIWAKSKK